MRAANVMSMIRREFFDAAQRAAQALDNPFDALRDVQIDNPFDALRDVQIDSPAFHKWAAGFE